MPWKAVEEDASWSSDETLNHINIVFEAYFARSTWIILRPELTAYCQRPTVMKKDCARLVSIRKSVQISKAC